MNAIKIEMTVQQDGELHLTQLPFRKGERVEAIVLSLSSLPAIEQMATDEEAEKRRRDAIQRFLERANASKFCSIGPYPTRDELHERR